MVSCYVCFQPGTFVPTCLSDFVAYHVCYGKFGLGVLRSGLQNGYVILSPFATELKRATGRNGMLDMELFSRKAFKYYRLYKLTLDFLTGRGEVFPANRQFPLRSPLWGLWWGLLLCVILTFCGQSSKFIYIDF